MKNREIVSLAEPLLVESTLGMPPVVNEYVAVERFDQGQSDIVSYLITELADKPDNNRYDLSYIKMMMEETFSDEDLRDLLFELRLNYDDIDGSGRSAKIRELILKMKFDSNLPKLIDLAAQKKPKVTWDKPPQKPKIMSKINIAVVIDIAKPALANVADYLDRHDISAHILCFRHITTGQFLNPHKYWHDALITFNSSLLKAKNEFVGFHPHFFVAGPGALLFGFGCLWGTVDEATIYHYERNHSYHKVIDLNRDLRSTLNGGW